METWLIALAGGAVGSLLTFALADSPIEIIDPARQGLPQAAQEAIVAPKNFV